MALQILFGDDEHTASDGPYARLMKVRKWIYLSSGLLIVLGSGLYSEAAAIKLFAAVRFPEWLLVQAVAAGLAYLVVQYALLAWQLRATYDLILKERLQFRRTDELQSGQARIDAALTRVAVRLNELSGRHASALENIDIEIEQAAQEIARLENDTALLHLPSDVADLIYSADELTRRRAENEVERDAARNRLENLRKKRTDESRAARRAKKYQSWRDLPDDDAARVEVETANRAYQELLREDPATRPGYPLAEKLIDFLRIIAPVGVACIATAKLV